MIVPHPSGIANASTLSPSGAILKEFEEALAHECNKRGLDGVVCGHIHHAEISRVSGIDYLNCGDWVESCTALIEHQDGHIELYRWHDAQAQMLQPVSDALEERAA